MLKHVIHLYIQMQHQVVLMHWGEKRNEQTRIKKEIVYGYDISFHTNIQIYIKKHTYTMYNVHEYSKNNKIIRTKKEGKKWTRIQTNTDFISFFSFWILSHVLSTKLFEFCVWCLLSASNHRMVQRRRWWWWKTWKGIYFNNNKKKIINLCVYLACFPLCIVLFVGIWIVRLSHKYFSFLISFVKIN